MSAYTRESYAAACATIAREALASHRTHHEQENYMHAAVRDSAWVNETDRLIFTLRFTKAPQAFDGNPGDLAAPSYFQVLSLFAYAAMVSDVKERLRIERAKAHIAQELAKKYPTAKHDAV